MIKPTQDYVLIKPDEAPKQSASGLYLAESWATVPPTGTVVACGPDTDGFKVGDHICYLRYAALQFNIDSEGDTPNQLVRQRHIVGLVND